MDIQKIVLDAVKQLTSDEKLMAAFKKDPVAVVEKKMGIDLPNDQINAVVEAIKAKIKVDDVADAIGGVLKLFK